MNRYCRSLFVLRVAAAIFGFSAILASSKAEAQSLPAATEADRAEKFHFQLPYELGQPYQIQQICHLEATTGEYSPDDRIMDIRQVVTATVRRDVNAPNVLTARIGRIVQRGGDSGRHFQVDCLAPNELPSTYKSDNWQFLLLFQADLGASGKLSNHRGSAELDKNQSPQYVTHPAVIAEHARKDDWVRQIVEEPTVYLPPAKVAVGDKWSYHRILRSFGDLPIYPAEAIDEEILCTLVSVIGTPQGRIATIDVHCVIGLDVPDQTCLKKAGQVKYNLDHGVLVDHTMTITGTLVRPYQHRPATISATLKVSMVSENTPTSPASTRDAPGRDILPAGLPMLDQDGEEVFVFDRGTKVVQDQSGKIWTLLPTPRNPEAAEKQAKMVYPVEINDPFRGIPGQSSDRPYTEMMVDLDGRAWWRYEGDRTTLTWIEGGKLQTQQIEGYYSHHAIPFPRVHGVTGIDLYVDTGGVIFAAGRKKLHLYDQHGWKDMDIPSGLGDFPMTQQQNLLFRRVGKAVYIARDFETSGPDAQCSLLAYTDGALWDTGIVSTQQATFLGQHEGHLLLGTSNRLWRLEPIQGKPADAAALAKCIDQLADDSYQVRVAALRGLELAGKAGIDSLQKALDASNDPEQRLRLKTVLRKFQPAPSARLVPANLGGFEALDFLFQARGGMQFYRPWQEGQVQGEDFLLCTDGGTELRRINFPRPDRFFQLQLETPDGQIIGRDSQCVFELDLKTLRFRDLFALGKFAENRSTRVVAVKDGQYCLRVDKPTNTNPSTLYFWFNPTGQRKASLLPGRPLINDISQDLNHEPDLGIVPGLDGRLWMIRRTGPLQCQLAYAAGSAVTTLAPRFAEGAVLFPLKEHAVMVLSYGDQPVRLHLGESIIEARRIQDLISEHYEQMVNLMPEATPYCASFMWNGPYLLRLGNDFWLKESYNEQSINGSGMKYFNGLYSGGQWQDCDIERVFGIDADNKRILTYDKDCRQLSWAGCADGHPKLDLVTQRDFPFGWCWYDLTNLPYYRSGMVLTEPAIDQMKEKLVRADADEKAKAEDFPAFRMWDGSKWVTWEGTLWGGDIGTDETGGIWHIRQRDVLVQLKDGRRQHLDLNDALHETFVHLVQERPGIVWLTTDQSVVRLVSESKDSVFGPYRVDRRFTTRNYGYSLRGPWIINSKHFYFASGGTLYYVPLEELLKAP